MSLARNRPLWLLVAAGIAARVTLGFVFFGTEAVDVAETAGQATRAGDLEATYEGPPIYAWPYPPPYLAWLVAADVLSDASGLAFHGVVKLVPILSDVAMALCVYAYLGWRGAGERVRLAAAALVLLGPSFIAASGYQGQIDSVAILPAILAVMAWERRRASRRALDSGLLVGLGAAIKIVPGLVVLPLLAGARESREGMKLLLTATAVPLVCLAPLYFGGIDLNRITEYGGVPSFGGLSLIVDPARGFDVFSTGRAAPLQQGGVGDLLRDGSRWITLLLLVGLAAFLFRYRPAPIDGTVLLWLAVFAFSPNFFLSYLVWALPFFLMAGYVRVTAVLQALLLPATVIYYLLISEEVYGDALAVLYVASLIALWAFWVVATFVLATRIMRQRESHPTGIQPPLARTAPESA